MAFAVIADLISRYGAKELAELADRAIPRVVTDALLTAGAAGDFSGMTTSQHTAVDGALSILNRGLADASEIVKGYVATRYPGVLVADPVPPVVNRLVCELARFEFHGNGAPEHVKDRAANARATLKDISNGVLTLGETADEGKNLSAGDTVEIVSVPRRFSRTDTGFV